MFTQEFIQKYSKLLFLSILLCLSGYGLKVYTSAFMSQIKPCLYMGLTFCHLKYPCYSTWTQRTRPESQPEMLWRAYIHCRNIKKSYSVAQKCDLASYFLLTFFKQHETSLCTIKQQKFHPRGDSISGVNAVISDICLSCLLIEWLEPSPGGRY